MAERIRIDHGSFEAGREKIQAWHVPASVKNEVRRFLDDLALGKVNRGRRISPQRQLKYLQALRAPLEFLHKPIAQITLRDVENFERALTSGKLANRFNGKLFAHSTQVDMRILLKIFLRWRLGKTAADKLTDWLDTRVRPKTPDFLNEAEVAKLYKHCRTARQRFLIAVLFDTGARAEEFHNIRFEDLYLPEGKENFVRIALKQEYSKTLGRTVALYWKYSVEAVQDYLADRIAAGIKPSDPIFEGNYAAIRKQLQRLGQRVLNRSVHYHLFRHSSTTHYATKLNRQELCYRYGWKFSSDMPDIYISRAGMESKQLDEKFTQTELGTLKTELARINDAVRIKDERLLQLQETVRSLSENVSRVAQVINISDDAALLKAVLERKRRQHE
jgi:integrase